MDSMAMWVGSPKATWISSVQGKRASRNAYISSIFHGENSPIYGKSRDFMGKDTMGFQWRCSLLLIGSFQGRLWHCILEGEYVWVNDPVDKMPLSWNDYSMNQIYIIIPYHTSKSPEIWSSLYSLWSWCLSQVCPLLIPWLQGEVTVRPQKNAHDVILCWVEIS